MAYLRSENEKLEIDYPIERIWAAIPEIVKVLDWQIEEKDESKHIAKVKTKGGFMAYGSIFQVELSAVDEKTTRMTINAETPVTTITSIIDFGRTRDRIGQFIEILAKQMEKKANQK
ncbi:MAG: hypothetical protein ACM3UL_04990 [Ignavibacteria bacterium]